MRLLDVGCGWGSLVIHAARHHGVEAVGVTISSEQAELARKRVAEAGLAGQVEIRVQDYRDGSGGNGRGSTRGASSTATCSPTASSTRWAPS